MEGTRRRGKGNMMKNVIEEKEDKGQGLIELVFSWSIADIMNKDLYRNKVNRIPDTFSSADHYLKSFVYPLIEETHADLRSNFTTLSHAPACEVIDVKKQKFFKPPKNLFYELTWKSGPGLYEPEFGDLMALTDIKPKCVDDLNRPKRPYLIALVEGKSEDSVKINVLSSKPIVFEKEYEEKGDNVDKLFIVHLTNLTTNMRIWKALHAERHGGNMSMINSVLRVDPSSKGDCNLGSSNKIGRSHISDSMDSIESLGLGDSQKAAVLNCITTTKCLHENTVKLIWGPPGTGKTKTISVLVVSLLRMKCRTLTCAPTNVAVLGVAKRLMSLISGTLKYDTYGLGDVVLFGNKKRMNILDQDDLYDFFLDHRVFVLAHCFTPLTGWKGSLESMIGLLEDPQGQYKRYQAKEIDEDTDGSNTDADQEEINEIENEINHESWNGTPKRNFWKELITRELKEKEKNSKEKKPPHSSGLPTGGEQEDKRVATEENVLLTFEEFFTKIFNTLRQQLVHCITGLYTHMPTSCLPFEVVNNMIIVLDMLQKIQRLPIHIDVTSDSKVMQCVAVMKTLSATFSVPNFFDYGQIRNFCLQNACLVFCTASSSAKLQTEGMAPFQLVIIDEAAQLKECESSIPLQLPGLRHAILVGDEKQLPAMVQSKLCERAVFGRSLFERLVILGQGKHLLNVQYRMDPSISLFPNMEFYNKQLIDGRNVLQRSFARSYLKAKMFGSYSFIDVKHGRENFDDKHSRRNMVEVSVLVEILSQLYKESIASKKKVRVGCISPYKAQVAAIEKRLGNSYSTNANDEFSVNVRSVDGFQGGEEDIIIISTVRCNGNGSVGFLSNCQRADVALTRAKFCLWILGNGATLSNSGSIWKKLVLDAKRRGCFYNACDNMSLALAISNALIELGEMNSLFDMNSVLFKTSKWKVQFSTEFKDSMKKLRQTGIHEEVISLVVKLSNGWRKTSKDDTFCNMGGASSQLMQLYGVKGQLKLIWTTDILQDDHSTETQVIKIWDVLPKTEIPKLSKKLDHVIGNYTLNPINRCLRKRVEGELTLPMTWAMDANFGSSPANHDLAKKLSAINLGEH
ncbi:uncharacterized protein [Primulina huaijiensis]|uniref:uncharacterized protein n=1 Tax=Primulina huaijiensis TaxID=1492673 RepID=UPI003CC7708A